MAHLHLDTVELSQESHATGFITGRNCFLMQPTALLAQRSSTAIMQHAALMVLQRFHAAELLIYAILVCAEKDWRWHDCT